jgi:hypothetical protein
MAAEEAFNEQRAQIEVHQRAEDIAVQKALPNPLPGPTKDALALDESVQAGKWRVRAFQDGDWEVLAALDHPLEKTMQAQLLAMFTGQPKPAEDIFIPRGPLMWQLAWVMTRDRVEVDKAIKERGADGVKELAKAEFSCESPYTLANVIYPAIMGQIGRSWSPAQGYGPEK